MVTYKITPEMHFMMLVQGEIHSNQQTWLMLFLLNLKSNNITNENTLTPPPKKNPKYNKLKKRNKREYWKYRKLWI